MKRELLAHVRAEFPGLQFTTVELIEKGWDHDVLILDEKYVFRFVKEPAEETSFQREIRFLEDFSGISNLPVPRYRWVSKTGTFGGYDIIPGRELTPQRYTEFAQERKSRFIDKAARFLTLLHNISLEKAKEYGFEAYSSWKDEMLERQRWFANDFKSLIAPKLTLRQLDFVEGFARDFYYSDYDIRPVLAHYDLSHDHILVKGQDISGIIDFGDLRTGDPAQELAGFFDYSHDLPVQLYEKYGGPKDDLFLKRAYQHYIHRWIYLHYDSVVRRKDDALWNEAQMHLDEIIRNRGLL